MVFDEVSANSLHGKVSRQPKKEITPAWRRDGCYRRLTIENSVYAGITHPEWHANDSEPLSL
ncbi:hypothetical protein GCM10009414_27820 [Tatumella terrea]